MVIKFTLIGYYRMRYIFAKLPKNNFSYIFEIKTSGSEWRGQEEAASTRIQANATTTVSYYTDGRSKFLKCCSSATITAIA